MSADFVTLAAAAQILRKRADDLGHIRNVMSNNAEVANWECAKADRYRHAVECRELDMIKVQAEIADLARAVQLASSMLLVQDEASRSVIDHLKP